MKKVINLMALFALAAGLSFTSCSKEDPAEAVPNEPSIETIAKWGTATIEGTVNSSRDVTIRVSAPYSQLTGLEGNYKGAIDEWVTTVRSDYSGRFAVSVYVGPNGSDVTLKSEQYYTDSGVIANSKSFTVSNVKKGEKRLVNF